MAQTSVISSKMTFWNLQRKVWDEVHISSTHEISGQKHGKNKKGNCDLVSHNSVFFLAIASLYLTILKSECEIKVAVT